MSLTSRTPILRPTTSRWVPADAEFGGDTEDDIEGQTTVFRPHPHVIKRRAPLVLTKEPRLQLPPPRRDRPAPPPLRFVGRRAGSEPALDRSPIDVSDDDTTKQIKIY